MTEQVKNYVIMRKGQPLTQALTHEEALDMLESYKILYSDGYTYQIAELGKTTEQVKRYHKSCLGLMEQCNDGEWVRSEDFEELKQRQETASNNAVFYSTSLEQAEARILSYLEELTKYKKRAKEWRTRAIQLSLLTLVSVIGLLLIATQGVYHG